MGNKFYFGLTLLTVVVIFICMSFRGHEKAQNPVRQIWEYKILRTYRETGKSWSHRFEDDKEIQVNSLSVRIKELGEQGWELVSVTAVSDAFHDGWEGYNSEGVKLMTTPSYAGFTNQIYYV